jgi:hypothetical protein
LSPAQAQDETGSQLILDTERNRAPMEPHPVLTSGGPDADQAKSFLRQRIKEQSQGRLTLFGFRQTAVKALDLELSGKPTCAVEFQAGVEFDGPCEWASRYRSRPLTFVILGPNTDRRGVNDRHVFRVEAKGERFVFQGYALFTREPTGWTVAGFGQTSRPVRESEVPDEASVQCETQLKQVLLAFRTWALDHDDHFPFNVSTNTGGTLELCQRGTDGFDTNSFVHFQVRSNELSATRVVVCPADPAKRPANSFPGLRAENVSYVVHLGALADETDPQAILSRCPIHGYVALCGGAVQKLKTPPNAKPTTPDSGQQQ